MPTKAFAEVDSIATRSTHVITSGPPHQPPHSFPTIYALVIYQPRPSTPHDAMLTADTQNVLHVSVHDTRDDSARCYQFLLGTYLPTCEKSEFVYLRDHFVIGSKSQNGLRKVEDISDT